MNGSGRDASTLPTADCYSGGERAWMLRTQALRGAWLAPLLRALDRTGVTPDVVTAFSLLAGLAFAPLLAHSPATAVLALALHVALDGVDGPLARRQGVASRRGSFTDTLADQVVVTTTTIALMTVGLVGVVPGTLYVFLYALVVTFAMVRNALDVPYSWLFRPRLPVYAWIAVEFFVAPGTLGFVHALAVALLGAKALSGFVRIRRSL